MMTLQKGGWLYLCILVCIACNDAPQSSTLENKNSKPNIIFIMADDLGYNELGCYGQQIIETPNIDALAKEGMRFTNHYSGSPVCAPSRCVLLTGQHAGHTYVRGNAPVVDKKETWDFKAMFDDPGLEGQRPIPDSIVTLAEILQGEGYTTGMVGKWGLGGPLTEGIPNKQGFDFFYGYNCQRQAHTYYPMHLWENEKKVLLNNKMVSIHSNLAEGADPSEAESYADFALQDYAPTLMHDKALDFVTRHKDQPFFFYYASVIPHLPLQAPEKWVKYYQDKLGKEEPFTGKAYFPNQTPRATYAAMISYLDEKVGDLVAKLKELGIYDNTLIVFSSDNGPSSTPGADTKFFNSAHPFVTADGRVKGNTYEGGLRVPMVVKWKGRVEPSSNSDHISAFYDWLPTLCDVVGAKVPTDTDGLSLLPSLLGEKQTKHKFVYFEIPEYGGQQAVRMGKWKGIRKEIKKGNTEIELYNLESDIQEQNNVARAHPLVVDIMEKIMKEEHSPSWYPKWKMEALGDE